ncbi:hypothetical protein L195_g023683 [Trifolium pratense]|uniref:Uncharacterized protein n=1 Tax=Trifolium pratense TaxID=57577 RepID=A0A2K3NBK4_TRIPR|nr:hypothetical protein L195_g023683 [Trifolium pratense]
MAATARWSCLAMTKRCIVREESEEEEHKHGCDCEMELPRHDKALFFFTHNV